MSTRRIKEFPKLKKGWVWLKTGQRTNPKTDFHCWPPWSATELRTIDETFAISPSIQGMVLRNKKQREKTIFTCNIENFFGGIIDTKNVA